VKIKNKKILKKTLFLLLVSFIFLDDSNVSAEKAKTVECMPQNLVAIFTPVRMVYRLHCN
jgi:hypothetical protein